MEASLADLAALDATAGGNQEGRAHRPPMLSPEEYAANDHAAEMEEERVWKSYLAQTIAEVKQGLAPKVEEG
eukprot:15879392-Heterocapsa_arctica.AAC.1